LTCNRRGERLEPESFDGAVNVVIGSSCGDLRETRADIWSERRVWRMSVCSEKVLGNVRGFL
jgi:hypothetical protein